MDAIFRWIEGTRLSMWIGQSESLFAFPTILLFHTIGMGMLVGFSVALNLRILGFIPTIPVKSMDGFFMIFRIGFSLNVLSGFLLLIAYPTKALTNPLFYVKLICIALAIATTLFVRRDALSENNAAPQIPLFQIKGLAGISLTLWAMAISFGRLLEYTYTRLYVDFNDVG